MAEAWGCPGPDSATARACRSQIWPKVSAARRLVLRTGADVLLPALIFALMRHAAPRFAPHAECAFVLEFVHEETDLHGATGYALTTFQAAVEGCALLTAEVL